LFQIIQPGQIRSFVRRIDDKGVTDLFQVGKSVQIGDFFSVCRSDGQAAFDFVYSCLCKIINLGLRGKYYAAALFDVCILINPLVELK
jgi:hypothetical protein